MELPYRCYMRELIIYLLILTYVDKYPQQIQEFYKINMWVELLLIYSIYESKGRAAQYVSHAVERYL